MNSNSTTKMFYKNVTTSPPIFIYILLCLNVVVISCKSSKNVISEENPENFDQFYDRFHQDTEFQMTRIAFPLEGGMEDSNGRVAWTSENWNPLKVKIQDIDTNTYKIDTKKTETRFEQKFWLPGSGFSSEYHFKRIKGQWFLVYAEDVNL